MAKPIDIVVTWPKTRSLESYLEALAAAEAEGAVINYRVARRPTWDFGALRDRRARCYMVHDGAVRGYCEILYVELRDEGEVRNVEGGYWPAGEYVVRDPEWHEIEPIPMRGFQGWRWFDEQVARRG